MIAPIHRDGDRLVSISEAMARTGLGRTKISELLLRGAIDSAKIGGRRLISNASLDRFIANALAANLASFEPSSRPL